MFIAFFVAFTIFVDAGYMTFRYMSYNDNSKKYTYLSNCILNITNSEYIDYDNVKADVGNLVLTSLTVELTDAEKQYSSEIIFSTNEEFMCLMYDGSFPCEVDAISEPIAVIGKSLSEYMYISNGRRYIRINNDEYLVVGITGDDYSDFQSNKIILFYNNIGDNLAKILQAQKDIEFRLSSNQEDVYGSMDKLYNSILSMNDNILGMVSDGDTQAFSYNVSMAFMDTGFFVNVLLILFCLINTVIITIYWTNKRYEEIYIKRVYGFSNLLIAFGILKEIVEVATVSAIVTFLTRILFNVFKSDYSIINSYYILHSIELFAVFIVIVSIVGITYPISYIDKTINLKGGIIHADI